MKHLILGLMLILSQAVFANNILRLSLENTDTANLQIDQAELAVTLAYPMESISGVCSLDIVADSYSRNTEIENLLKQVEIFNFFQHNVIQPLVISNTVLRVNLAPSYVDGVRIRTKDGQSLKSAIAKTLGVERKVVIMPRSCN